MFIDVHLKFRFANRSDEFPFYIVISILCSFVVWVFFLLVVLVNTDCVYLKDFCREKKVKAEVLPVFLTSAYGL